MLTLAGTHAASSLLITKEQSDAYFVHLFWMFVHKTEMTNVRECAVDRRTPLTARNRRLVLMDTKLCRSFDRLKIKQKKLLIRILLDLNTLVRNHIKLDHE